MILYECYCHLIRPSPDTAGPCIPSPLAACLLLESSWSLKDALGDQCFPFSFCSCCLSKINFAGSFFVRFLQSQVLFLLAPCNATMGACPTYVTFSDKELQPTAFHTHCLSTPHFFSDPLLISSQASSVSSYSAHSSAGTRPKAFNSLHPGSFSIQSC